MNESLYLLFVATFSALLFFVIRYLVKQTKELNKKEKALKKEIIDRLNEKQKTK